MTMVISITKCAECPLHGFGLRGWYCTKHRENYINDMDTIPDWCPLERAPEQKEEA